MPHFINTLVIGIGLALVAGWFWRRWQVAQQRARQRLAMLQFPELRDALEQQFLAAAAATGKPRGLRWKKCELDGKSQFATDRTTGELYALAGTTVSFEAIPGGDMEDVEAVGNLRSATAIFIHRSGKWSTDGRVVFNLEPHEALERYQESLEEVGGK
jgi:hypothetical protein